jgi:integrase/recombinase XerD
MSDTMVKKKRNKRRPITDARLHFALPYVGAFYRWLEARKYTKGTIAGLVTQFGHWTQWVHEAGFGVDTIHAGYAASVPALKKGPYSNLRLRAGALFVLFLEDQGLVAPLPKPPSPTEKWPILGEFRDWMRRRRGALDSSLDTYQTILRDLMRLVGDDPQAYTSQSIRDFVLERASQHGLASARMTVTATRSFLRFLIAVGRCPAGRDYAIPNFAGWQLAPVPYFLDEKEIKQIIAACDGQKRLRDRAVILLLARLGLRGGEVANLEFSQIDWANGRIAIVGGKSRRAEWLPLPQEVGEALLAYLNRARPRLATPRVFVTAQNPMRPMTRFAVTCLVQAALERAGIKSARRGSHILRHSAATAMLRHGISLAGVGAVLRHRCLSTTMQYAKVDFALLREIAQPWAGRSSC